MNAGLSAVKMGLRLWGRHLLRWSRWAGALALGTFAATWSALSVSPLGAAALAGAVGVAMLALTGARCPDDAKRWIQGGLGERRTARKLAAARRFGSLRGWWFAHDLKIPRSRANLDHVAVHPSGELVVYLDTKAWHAAGARVRVDGARLMYGPWDKTKALDTIQWEASRLLDGLKGTVPVIPVLVCDGASVEGRAIDLDGMWVVASDELPRLLRSLSRAPRNRRDAQAVRELIKANFPAK